MAVPGKLIEAIQPSAGQYLICGTYSHAHNLAVSRHGGWCRLSHVLAAVSGPTSWLPPSDMKLRFPVRAGALANLSHLSSAYAVLTEMERVRPKPDSPSAYACSAGVLC